MFTPLWRWIGVGRWWGSERRILTFDLDEKPEDPQNKEAASTGAEFSERRLQAAKCNSNCSILLLAAALDKPRGTFEASPWQGFH